MKVCFFNASGRPFDVLTPEQEPLGGSESCIAYLASELARSMAVSLIARTGDGRVLRGVRHLDVTQPSVPAFLGAESFDVIVIVNSADPAPALRLLSPASRIVLWNHHAPDQPAVQSLARTEVAAALDRIVYVSHWQRSETEKRLRIAVTSAVIGNGLTPAFANLFSDPRELLAAKEPPRAAYTSTPFRGLDVLLDAYARLEQPPQLEVFSSMQVYGADETPFRALYQRARSGAHVHYHGSVAQPALATAMRGVSFLSYPCTFPETFCIAALEAMAAGATVIATALGALPSTTMGYGELLPLTAASRAELAASYARFFAAAVARARAVPQQWAERMFEQVAMVNRECTWSRRAADWQTLFAGLAGARV
jgi:glycosyltransferase involved in cell wall biosynthesis